MTSASFALPPAARCDRPDQVPDSADTDQPGRFAQGPEEKKGRLGFWVGLDISLISELGAFGELFSQVTFAETAANGKAEARN